MTVLELVQTVALDIGLPDVATVVGSTETTVKQMLSLLHREGRELRSKHAWPELTRQHSMTLVSGTASYAFPADYDRQIFETHWDDGQSWALEGPLSPQEWQARQHGLTGVGPERRYRVKGFADAQFFLDPTPAAGDAGDIIYFEYQSRTWCRPKTWTASTTFAPLAYCWYNGNLYRTTLGGVTGSTAPTHTTGSTSDGGVSWTYQTAAYEKFLADTDEPILDENLLMMGLHWRWLRSKRMPYQDLYQEYEAALMRDSAKKSSAPVLYLHGRRSVRKLLGADNLPGTGYGS